MNDIISKKLSIRVAILAYNEDKTIEKAVMHVYTALKKDKGRIFEIVIIDDGSKDKTGEIAQILSQKYPEIKVIHHKTNRGPGSGIITALENCDTDIFTFFAADFQGNFEERIPYLKFMDQGTHVLIGYRLNYPHKGVWRRVNSFMFIKLMNFLFALDYSEYNFFYFFRKEVFSNIKTISKGVFIAPELMIMAIDRGLKVKAIPGNVRYRTAGKASLGKPKYVFFTAYEMFNFWICRKLKLIKK